MTSETRVSVIIPTIRRPGLVTAAVDSALTQTLPPCEVIVVISGPDPETQAALERYHGNERVKIIASPVAINGNRARNLGVDAATGDWIAFLDDDDAFHPTKLEKQVAAARDSGCGVPLVSCLSVVRWSGHDEISPRRLPSPGESIIEYVLVRKSWQQGDAGAQTSTLLAPAAACRQVRWKEDLALYQDFDWVARLAELPDCRLIVVPEVLLTRNMEERPSVSRVQNWKTALAWVEDSRERIGARAYASFLLVDVVPRARQQGAWHIAPSLLWRALRRGSPSGIHLGLFFILWLVPKGWRAKARALRHRIRVY